MFKNRRCTDCQIHLVAYIHNELPERTRRRVGLHLRSCDRCYEVYRVEQGRARQLENELARFGEPSAQQLTSVWEQVQVGLVPQPTQSPWVPNGQFRQGIVVLAFMALCMLPWLMNVNHLATASPTMNATPVRVPEDTPTGTEVAVKRDAVFEPIPTEDTLPPTPTSTPPGAPIPQIVETRENP